MAHKHELGKSPIGSQSQVFRIEMAPQSSGQQANITVTIESPSADEARRIAEDRYPQYVAVSFVRGKKLSRVNA
jgi:hypothetical protein